MKISTSEETQEKVGMRRKKGKRVPLTAYCDHK